MRSARSLTATLLTLALVIGAALGVAQAQQGKPQGAESSRGVIVRPGGQAAGLAALKKGDTPLLGGQRVTVKQADAEVGLLVSSAGLGDADLAHALAGAGFDAEVNHLRHILPVTPTAELFRAPLSARPEGLPNRLDFWHVEQVGADIVHTAGITGTSSTIVGVIDTGVYTDHPLLANVLLPGFDFVNSDSEAEDYVGHGTHVAGIVHSI